jgi:hypothetical protein
MRRLLSILAIAGLLLAAPAPASARVSPAGLQEAGWECILPPPEFNPYVHCVPADQLAGIISGHSAMVTMLTFRTSDMTATDAELLGTERMIRADLFHGQPCPTDPPGYTYSWLFPRFGWDYYICHTFDSPW